MTKNKRDTNIFLDKRRIQPVAPVPNPPQEQPNPIVPPVNNQNPQNINMIPQRNDLNLPISNSSVESGPGNPRPGAQSVPHFRHRRNNPNEGGENSDMQMDN